ncbi:MAG: aminobenzoyl-glutamate transporter [Oscillospiraceae bacterium]|nr:MAG: aminobenzoyl-glutamate transporter [Oscillospiraceae bacterium]
MSKKEQKAGKTSLLDKIEVAGNKLPHPVAMFAILGLITIVLSAICAAAGVSVVGETVGSDGTLVEKTYTVTSLLSRSGLSWMLINAATNFTSYAPLGTVIIAMVGIGMADGSGYISALLKKVIAKAPQKLIVPCLVWLGVMGNISSDAGYVIVIPIGMMIMYACGRHPLAGFAATLAGVSGGYSANMLITSIDPILAGVSTDAAHIVDPNYTVSPAANWYFMIASTVLLTIVGTLITTKIVEPHLGTYTGTPELNMSEAQLNEKEEGALKSANIILLVLVAIIVVLCIPQNSFLRDAETGSLIDGALISGVTTIISLVFFATGTMYGYKCGKFKNHRDVCSQIGSTMANMGSYLALAVVASQFIKYFNYTGLGNIVSVIGANFLSKIEVSPIVLIVCFIIFCAFMNLLMASASAKWTLLAPIFVPMFMKIGYAPELMQAAYRIADSSTNIISPVMAYLAVMIVFCQKYDKSAGLGTIWSLMLPYSICFIVSWTILLIVFILAGIPLGPGASIFLF